LRNTTITPGYGDILQGDIQIVLGCIAETQEGWITVSSERWPVQERGQTLSKFAAVELTRLELNRDDMTQRLV
jgi:hypothetical protein